MLHNNEVWLKVGGDYGGDTFKFWITPLVYDKPDQVTVCTMLFAAQETRVNLAAAIPKISPALHRLQEAKWR